MQPLVQRLRDLLQRLPLPTVLRWPLDVASCRQGVLHVLERIHQRSFREYKRGSAWLEEGRLDFLLTHLDAELPGSFPIGSLKRRNELFMFAIVLGLEGDSEEEVRGLTAPAQTELARLTTRAWASATVFRYAQRIGLLRLDQSAAGKPWVFTQAGGIFLELVGSDAIHWLLVLEVVRNSGEPELLDPLLARRLMPTLTGKPSTIQLGNFLPGNVRVFDRLQSLRLLSGSVYDENPQYEQPNHPDPESLNFSVEAQRLGMNNPASQYSFVFDLSPLGKEVLGEIAKDEDSPMKLLALALHRDQMTQVRWRGALPRALRSPRAPPTSSSGKPA